MPTNVLWISKIRKNMKNSNKKTRGEQNRSYPFGNQSFISNDKRGKRHNSKPINTVKVRCQHMQTASAHSAVTHQWSWCSLLTPPPPHPSQCQAYISMKSENIASRPSYKIKPLLNWLINKIISMWSVGLFYNLDLRSKSWTCLCLPLTDKNQTIVVVQHKCLRKHR